MIPGGSNIPTGSLAEEIDKEFGSYDAFKEKFTFAATTLFGSGWAWLVKDSSGIHLAAIPNQDSPLSDETEPMIPLLGLDVWEHAYYLKYQNMRADYVSAWWNVVNWDIISQRFEK